MPRPIIRPFDVASSYSRIGGAVQDVFEAPAKGLELYEKLKTQKLTQESTRLSNEAAQRLLDEAEAKKNKFIELKTQYTKELYDNWEEGVVTGEEMAGPPAPGEEAPRRFALRDKMTEQQFIGTLDAIQNAKNVDDLARININLDKLLRANMPKSSDYGGSIQFNNWSSKELGKEGFMDDIAKINESQKKVFFNEKLPKSMQAYQKTLTGKGLPALGTREGFQSFLIESPEYSDMATPELFKSKEYKEFINRQFPSAVDVDRAKSAERASKQKAAKERTSQQQNVAMQNEKVRKDVQAEIGKQNASIEKMTGREYAALKGDAQFLAPEKLDSLQIEDRAKVEKNAQEIEKRNIMLNIIAEGDRRGELVTGNTAKRIYEDIIDGKFTTPKGKIYGPALGMQADPVGEAEVSAEEAPAVESPPTAPQAPTGGLPSPTTQEEYDAIPSGTQYRHPDGTIKRKK